MSARREQALGALLFMALLIVGWTPFVITTSQSGVHHAPEILICAVFAIFAAALTYDATEKLLGAGKGVYATGVLASFAPAAIVLSEPSLLPASSMMFVTAATLWFAARATQETYREALFFIALLAGISCAVFGIWPQALLPLGAYAVLRERARIPIPAYLLSFVLPIAGLFVSSSGMLALPNIFELQPQLDVTTLESALLILPWSPWVVALFFARPLSRAVWPGVLAALVTVLLLLAVLLDVPWLALLGSAAPLIASLLASLLTGWFESESEERFTHVKWVALPVALGALLLLIARLAHWPELVVLRNHAVLALFCAALLGTAIVRDARRWLFAMLVIAGWIFAAVWWAYVPGTTYAELPIEPNVTLWFAFPFVLVVVLARRFYGPRMPRRLLQPGPTYRFDDARFRRFDRVKRSSWEGEAVELVPADPRRVTFALFGDVAGSEFPISSRKSGYHAFREIVAEINARNPDFVLSPGDLASRASRLAYRRLRQLLRHVRVPLLVTPGNHDVYERGKLDTRFFHALFGSDHGDVTVGSLRIILINNARGSFVDEQWTWIEQTLATTTTAEHCIVLCHKPLLDPRESQYYGMEIRDEAARLRKLLADNRVSAVFSGHIHSLLHAVDDDVHYVISGGGGSKLKSAQDRHHYLWCEATSDALSISACVPGSAERPFELTISRRA